VTLRKAALALQKTNLARAKALMQRAVMMTLTDKDKTPGLVHGHIGALAQLKMLAEAKALTEKLPGMFTKKADQAELALMLPTCYGAVGLFPRAIALAEKLPAQKQRGKLTELIDQAIEQKNTPVFEQLVQKLTAWANKDPELKKDPTGPLGVTLLFNMIRLGALLRHGKTAEAVPLLQKTMAEAEKLPITEPREKAELPLGLAELIVDLLRKKG
jgi:IDEAL domain